MPQLTYSVADFQPFTVIRSSEVNAKFNDIKTLLNTTKLDDDNIQDAGITRATKLKLGTADHVVINSGTGAMSSEAQLATTRGGLGFNPSFTNNAGKAVIVNSGETALELGTPNTDILVETLASHVVTLTAGENISIRDAVCLDLNQGAYKVFRCDSDSVNIRKNNFLGFARAAATTTPQISTYTISADFVASNSIQTTINGRVYTDTYASSSDETLQAVADTIETDPDVLSAVVTVVGGNQTGTDDRVITITGRGGLTLNISAVVTGGASQPTVTVANTQSPSGQNVQIQTYGPLGGFSSLTVGDLYYVSTAAGSITNAPSDSSPQRVGQALSSSVIFINRLQDGYTFPSTSFFLRTHGATSLSSANATSGVEQFNFSSWSTGVSSAAARWVGQYGEGILSNRLYYIDGADTANTVTATTTSTNKVSWTTGATRTSAKGVGGMATLGSNLVCSKGSTNLAATNTGLDTYNGTAWTNGAGTYAAGGLINSSFAQGGYVRTFGGGGDEHETWNGSSVSSDTVFPTTTYATEGSASPNGGIANDDGNTTSYEWSGSSWSGALTMPYITNAAGGSTGGGPSSGWSATQGKAFINGGNTTGSTATNQTAAYNGSSWSATTASSVSTSASTGGVL